MNNRNFTIIYFTIMCLTMILFFQCANKENVELSSDYKNIKDAISKNQFGIDDKHFLDSLTNELKKGEELIDKNSVKSQAIYDEIIEKIKYKKEEIKYKKIEIKINKELESVKTIIDNQNKDEFDADLHNLKDALDDLKDKLETRLYCFPIDSIIEANEDALREIDSIKNKIKKYKNKK